MQPKNTLNTLPIFSGLYHKVLNLSERFRQIQHKQSEIHSSLDAISQILDQHLHVHQQVSPARYQLKPHINVVEWFRIRHRGRIYLFFLKGYQDCPCRTMIAPKDLRYFLFVTING